MNFTTVQELHTHWELTPEGIDFEPFGVQCVQSTPLHVIPIPVVLVVLIVIGTAVEYNGTVLIMNIGLQRVSRAIAYGPVINMA